MEYPVYEEYPAVYRDARGEEATVIRNDGESLRMTVRGVEFKGWMVDDFEPVKKADPALGALFTLNQGSLCGCEISYEVALPLVDRGRPAHATLHIRLVLGLPAERGWLNEEKLTLTLSFNEHTYQSHGDNEWFEDELLQIQASLPDAVYLKCCINCAYSDYSIYGHGLFGGMFCYRNNKAEYLKARTKREISEVEITDRVQETYLCPEFERRKPGTGYRG